MLMKVIIYSKMVNWQKMKIKLKNISSENQQISGKDRAINAFESSKMYTRYH